VESLTQELEEVRSKKRALDTELESLRMENSYIESKNKFLNEQIEKGKAIHETLVSAIKNQLNNDDNNSINQIYMANKTLQETIVKHEAKIKLLETKVAQYKIFKKLVQQTTSVQLKGYNRLLPIKKALQIAQNEGEMDFGVNYASNSEAQTNETGAFKAAIVHTYVKEDPETSKVYSEYVIEMRKDEAKWALTRKYKEFVELHQNLIHQFPNIEFPSSTSQILGFTPNISAWISSKRRTVIEDRRKALEMYLNELLGMPELAGCELLVAFLDLEGQEATLSIPPKEGHEMMHRNHRSATVKENFNNSKLSRFEFSRFSEKTKYYKQQKSGNKFGNMMADKPAVSNYEAKVADMSPYKYKKSSKPLHRILGNSPYY
jgi:hypothetical protein